jgi:hypothetical protein
VSLRFLTLLLGVVGAIALLVWWSRPASLADQISTQAVSPEQARLWKDVAARGTPASLERLAQTDSAVQRRRPPQLSAQPVPGGASLAPGVETGLRVVSAPESAGPPMLIAGQAKVDTVVGDRVELDLGNKRRLVFVARLSGKPLNVAQGQAVDIDFQWRPSVFDAQEILAIRTQAGAELITAAQSSAKPVVLTVTLPSLVITAAQIGKPEKGAMNVVVTVGGGKAVLTPGQTAPVGGRSVKLIGSLAEPANAGAIDGSPYSIDLIVWR